MALSATFSESSFSPLEQQVVLLATAVENHCSYSVAAHSMLFEKAGGDSAALKALREGNSIHDSRLEALRRFTLQVVAKPGGWVKMR